MFDTIQEIERANENHGHHFFEPSSKRFFRSRIGETVYGGRYFITSEQFDYTSPRLYTVRMARDDGSIETIGDFQAFRTASQARAAIRATIREQDNA